MKSKISSSIVIIVVAFFATSFFFVGCDSTKSEEGTIDLDKIKSIKIVTMTKELNTATDSSFIKWVKDICQGPNDTYYINDAVNHRIVQFTKDDELLNIIGRQGEGPGEFIVPHCIKYYDNEEYSRLYVLDNGGNRLQMFDSNGKYVDNKSKIDISAYFFDIDNDGNIIAPMRTDYDYFLTKFSPSGEVLKKLIPIDKNDPLLFEGEGRLETEVIYDKKNDFYWIFFTSSPNIKIYNGKGDLVKEIKFIGESIDETYKKIEEFKKPRSSGIILVGQVYVQRNAKLLPNGNLYVYLPFSNTNIELSYENNKINITKYEIDIEGKIAENYSLSLINGKYYTFSIQYHEFYRSN